ncbi:MAG: para-nitrobenzyl esterase [Rubrobacteraceae bacterium]|nr:para-nitrobenzyl esterase [Rubrobacteraceae bacterium]
MQSAGFEPLAGALPRSSTRVQKATEQLFDRPGSRDLLTLRQIPVQEVLQASLELSGVITPPGQVHTPANLVWNPVSDGDVVAEQDFSGWAPNVPVMLGSVENEARYFIKPTGTYTRDTVVQMARVLSGPRSRDVLALFDRTGGTWYEALDRLITTAIWTEPALATLKRFDQQGRRVYAYHFARVAPDGRRTGELAKHTSEIRYVFGNLVPTDAYNAVDADISRAMQGAWIEFGRTGVPCNPDGSPWPCYDRTAPFLTWIEDEMTSPPLVIDELTTLIHSLRMEDDQDKSH